MPGRSGPLSPGSPGPDLRPYPLFVGKGRAPVQRASTFWNGSVEPYALLAGRRAIEAWDEEAPLPSDTFTDVEAFLLRPEDNLHQAIGCLRANRLDLAVVGHEGRVVGSLTDSDIRRAVLTGHLLEDPVGKVMTNPPIVAAASASEEEIDRLLHSHRLRSIPVVDEGKLVAVRSLQGFPHHPPMAVIMAGGRGQRLRPFTDKVPKPLLKVGAKSIVERLVQGLADAGIRDVFLAVSYKAELFEERLGCGSQFGVNLHYLYEDEPLGTAGALSLLPGDHEGPIVVTNGDILTTVNFARVLDFHWRHSSSMTLAAIQHLSLIPYGTLEIAGHHLLSIQEKPERKDLCSAGIYVLDPDVLEFMPPSGVPVAMPELVTRVLEEGRPVHVFPLLEKWFDVGEMAAFERVLVEFAIGEEGWGEGASAFDS